MIDDLDLPTWLRRGHADCPFPIVPRGAETPLAAPPPPQPEPPVTSPGFSDDAELRREADRLWRNWTPSAAQPHRPPRRTFLKQLRADQAAQSEDHMKSGPKEAQLRALRERAAVKPAAKRAAAAKAKKTTADAPVPVPPKSVDSEPIKTASDSDKTTTINALTNQENTMPNSKKKAVRRKASSNAGAKKTRRYDWKEAEQQASAKKMPPPLDFSADTHKPWRKLLGDVTTLAKARDIGGLKKIKINPSSSSPKAVDRYRKLCILALSS